MLLIHINISINVGKYKKLTKVSFKKPVYNQKHSLVNLGLNIDIATRSQKKIKLWKTIFFLQIFGIGFWRVGYRQSSKLKRICVCWKFRVNTGDTSQP